MAASAHYATVQQLYVAYFGRPADKNGLEYYASVLDTNPNGLKALLHDFAASAESTALYAQATIAGKIAAMYETMFGRVADADGLVYWTQQVQSGKVILSEVAFTIAFNAQAADKAIFAAKVTASTAFTTALNLTPEILAYETQAGVGRTWLKPVVDAATAATVAATADATISALVANGGSGSKKFLTNGTDVLEGSVFEAGLVYTPSGDDRINALQSEDILTGTAASNVLNATLGNNNDNGAASVTPTLKNIQTVNLDITGNTNTLDVRFADSLQNVAINKLTAEAGNAVTVANIGQPAANLTVKNSALVDNTVTFNYVTGVLAAKNAAGTAAGGNVGNIAIENVALAALNVGNTGNTEGFETVNLTSKGNNTVKVLNVVDAETVTITGSGSLNMVNNTQAAERVVVGAGGVTIGDGIGIRTIDSTGFTGDVNINITAATGPHNDPGNSGKVFHSVVKTGAGNDTLWTTAAVTGTAVGGVTTLSDTIDGGAGTDTLRTYAGVTKDAKITNVEALEMRGTSAAAFVNAFDANLASVLVRNESGAPAQTFTLNNTTKALAEGGKIFLNHSTTGGGADTVDVRLADGSGANDTVVLTVQNDLNTTTTYNYTLSAQSQLKAVPGTATAAQIAATKIENVTINDNDTETNTLTLTHAADHNGKVMLTGGTAGLDYTVASTLIAKEVFAEGQLSNLRLTVGVADQKIALGAGSDILTFQTLDSFNGLDTITDAGGVDTVRAAFSKDVTGTPALANIEKLHIVATENVAIDMSKATTVSELAILSNQAVNGDGDLSPTTAEPFGIAAGVEATDIITLNNTALSTLNFFGDNDTVDEVAPVVPVSESGVHIFNGVTLANNTGDALAVSINSSIDPAAGATSYTTGQLTAHGVKNMTVTVGNELAIAAGATASATTTTINNVFGKNLETFTATANGSLTLGVVSGTGLANTMTSFDTTNVKGALNAHVIILGDNAKVNLGNGANTFNALGSAGKGVTITSGSANDTITGTAQSDTIRGGAGNDVINANRGDNIVEGGAGDETVTAGDGNNTVSFGSGHYETAQINVSSANDASKANNSFSLAGTTARLQIDVTGDGLGVGDVDYTVAVGNGSDLTLNWQGGTFTAASSVLDGRLAVVDVVTAATNNSDLFIDTAAGAAFTSQNGGAGNDVLIGWNTAATYTMTGGAGNDALISVGGADVLTGGIGADRIVIVEAAAASDTVAIADGDSIASGFDQVTGFAIAGANTDDVLDLAAITVAGNVAAFNGTNVGTLGQANFVAEHTVAAGIVTFGNDDVTAGLQTVSVSSVAGAGRISLDAAIAYLVANTANLGVGNTVAFGYDTSGDGVADNTIVFQDGAADTVVELIGVVGTSVAGFANLAAAQAANVAGTIELI
jgi:hypothetical protein